ncbi:lipopolysaccharide biosynthesis protein [Trueperella bonasi]|uniref:Lipopolysaccharide biosynthesis protein n=1 Tax=Trueperella bonasi TaxID=312286 RepID=A0ABT9NGQ9_9ACTO|nr:glycoside hydrolase family 99-like domain-containing protein [Trueperella bonasi]MDP9805998.1 lipopolysaccharide biosynthesis protein [Trueperella bonasi]
MENQRKNTLARRVQYVGGRLRAAAVNTLMTGSPLGYRSKHVADFRRYVDRQGGRQNPGFPEKWRLDPQFDIDQPAKVAVVIHCFYPELLSELLDHVANIPVDYDLFITNASGEELPVPEQVSPCHRATVVVKVANHGRDIFPTVQLVNYGALNPYELILKLHTKKSAWREDHETLSGTGEQWKDQFLDDLVGSEEKVSAILDAFASDASLGTVTATGSIVGCEHWGGNQRIVEQLMRRIEMFIDADKLRFASGSMYWTRGFLLQSLRAFNLQKDDFDDEAGQIDGTTAHAIERILGIVAEESGLTIAEPADLEPSSGSDLWKRYLVDAERSLRARVIPFYLPQFHDSPQNNKWWGEGFTEWTNVTSAVPAYIGHYQPRIPTELGFYDLELDSVRAKQHELAAEHGVAGFMYYYYWFSGERLLNRPIEKMHDSELDIPYCIMWANENWTRRWDGRSQDILIGQNYDEVPAEDFIDDVMDFLKDPRYMCYEGKPILAVYRPGQMENFPQVVATWRERARAAGLGELYILAVSVAKDFGAISGTAADNGLDGTLQFPPHNLPWVAAPAAKIGLDHRWRGNLMSYDASAAASVRMANELSDTDYPGAMVTFDNTARRQWRADAWFGSNPYTFRRWVGELVNSLAAREPKDRILFINAWNEWAEGAVLEPTTRFGRTYLLALRDVLYS